MKKVFTAIVALALVFCFGKANACTNFLITKGASTDGSCMISYACALRRALSLPCHRLA